MLIIWLGALLVIVGVLFLANSAIWRGRLSGQGASPSAPAATLEPPRRGMRFLGLDSNWPGIVMIVVLLRLMSGTRPSLDWRYGLFLGVLLFTIAFGWAVQDVPTGAMLAGARSYLKFIPFFLLPAVHRFTPRQLQVQLMVVLAFALLQTPLAFFQRFVQFADAMHTGDPVRGTGPPAMGLTGSVVVVLA